MIQLNLARLLNNTCKQAKMADTAASLNRQTDAQLSLGQQQDEAARLKKRLALEAKMKARRKGAGSSTKNLIMICKDFFNC